MTDYFIQVSHIISVAGQMLLTQDIVWNAVQTRMWANDQRDGRPAEHRWRPLFNATKFG